MVSQQGDQLSNTLPRTQKPNRSREGSALDRASTSIENEGYLIVAPNEVKARFKKSNHSRTRSDMRPSSASYADLPKHEAPPPPLAPRTTSAGELTHYSTLPRIAELSETAPTSPTVANGSYFVLSSQADLSRQADPSRQADLSRQSITLPADSSLEGFKGHKKTQSLHSPDDLDPGLNQLQYADVAPSGVTGMRWMDKTTNRWYIDPPVEPMEDQPGPSNRPPPLRPTSIASSFGRVSFTLPPTPQKEAVEADPLLISDLGNNADGEVVIQLPQRNPSFRRHTFPERVKHLDLINFFVLADCVDYTVITVIAMLFGIEALLLKLIFGT
uniref:Transmembrane protein n=1 Tax=Steinernema glaseri TaxID=37863 RepID=A0A1I7YJG6_9BILA